MSTWGLAGAGSIGCGMGDGDITCGFVGRQARKRGERDSCGLLGIGDCGFWGGGGIVAGNTTIRMNAPSSARSSRGMKPGCVFYGCLTLGILGLLLGTGLGVGAWYVMKKFNAMVEEYTAVEPVELPSVEMSESDYAALTERVTGFGQALRDGTAVEPLVLTADEINVLLARGAVSEAWQGRLHVRMEGDQVRGQMSLPLDLLAQHRLFARLRGRYLNGAVRLGVGMEGGRLAVRLVGAEVNGQAIPAEVMQALQSVNLADPAYNDPAQAGTLSRIGRVEVKEGRLVVVPGGS
jgi:hypothetical protein